MEQAPEYVHAFSDTNGNGHNATQETLTIREINHAYRSLASAMDAYYRKAAYVANLKATLQGMEADFIARGLLEGKNEEARKANLYMQFDPERVTLRKAEGDERLLELAYKLARNEVERVRAIQGIESRLEF